jgi:hypothetical protein
MTCVPPVYSFHRVSAYLLFSLTDDACMKERTSGGQASGASQLEAIEGILSDLLTLILLISFHLFDCWRILIKC